jgi:hypothetical protein
MPLLVRLSGSAPVRHLVVARSVDWLSLHAPAMPLLVRLSGSAPVRHLVLARSVDWLSLHVPAMLLLVRSLGSALVPRLVLTPSVRWPSLHVPAMLVLVRSLGSALVPRLVLARSVGWPSLNVPAMPLLVRSLGCARVRGLVLARLVDWTRLNDFHSLPAPLWVRLVHLIGTPHFVPALSPCLNAPAMPLLMRLAESAWPLLIARPVNWTRLDCVKPLPSSLFGRLVHSLWALHVVRVLYVDWTRRSERLNLLRCCYASACRCPVDRVSR